MKLHTSGAQLSCLLVLLFSLISCIPQEAETEIEPLPEPIAPVERVEQRNQLPVQYRKPSYTVDTGTSESLDEVVDDVALKVGASIRSTQGPQPLWDILKRLAALKRMSVSWASDVDQNVLVDVDISADDDFYSAVKNLLRQVDCFHEMEGATIVVKYKETRQFHVAMPFTKSLYETATGGNVLGSNDAAGNIVGTMRLDSKGNEFDIWKNIQDNMDAILDTWSTSITAAEPEVTEEGEESSAATTVTRQISTTVNRYTIDKPIGLITVHAPRPLLEKLDAYFKNLKRELYKQISIEAKIIEVELLDHSSIGLDWNMLLKNLSMAGAGYSFGKSKSDVTTDNDSNNSTYTQIDSSITTDISAATVITNGLTEDGAAAVSLAAFTFDSFLNAVKEQGQTTILSNPKLSVLNGQPALLTVGRNVTYIDSIDSKVDKDNIITYTVKTERVLSGVGMALTANILDDNEIILNLVPVTSELQEPIEYRDVGLGQVGLPIINVREMSTTVRVKDGEILVIGGLISDSDKSDGTFVPGTSNIPFFKYLFGYEEKTSRKRELIILLKPRII